ncbi:hypothetical protein FXO37_06233 [Capsicum annuum]|nr:hypothetical protein FXO37_06233 [Capsicum annuum]
MENHQIGGSKNWAIPWFLNHERLPYHMVSLVTIPYHRKPSSKQPLRTNIYINPPVAPPLVGGYGYGVPFYGGWGWSPFSFFAPGPGVAVGIGGGFDTLVLFLVLGAVTAFLRRVLGKTRDEDEY